jgi:hypothetical protein
MCDIDGSHEVTCCQLYISLKNLQVSLTFAHPSFYSIIPYIQGSKFWNGSQLIWGEINPASKHFFFFFFFDFLWPQAWSLNPSLRCLLHEGRAAGFEPELVKLAGLPCYQWAIPALSLYIIFLKTLCIPEKHAILYSILLLYELYATWDYDISLFLPFL